MRIGKISTILIILGVTVSIISINNADAYKPDMFSPLKGFLEKLTKLEALDIGKLISGVLALLKCVGGLTNSTMLHELEDLSFPLTGATVFRKDLVAGFGQLNMTDEQFQEIHAFLWNPCSQWTELIDFLYNNGYKEESSAQEGRDIYKIMHAIYRNIGVQDPDQLEPPLPTEPWPQMPPENCHQSRTFQKVEKTTPIFISLFAEDDNSTCSAEEWLKALEDIIASQGLQWLDLLKYVIKEINTNPSTHIFWHKLSEPKKGEEFKEFLKLKGVASLLEQMNDAFLRNELVELIIGIVEGITGINFKGLGINVVKNLVHMMEFFVWRTTYLPPI